MDGHGTVLYLPESQASAFVVQQVQSSAKQLSEFSSLEYGRGSAMKVDLP